MKAGGGDAPATAIKEKGAMLSHRPTSVGVSRSALKEKEAVQSTASL
jgi:hypothetical protein